LALATLQNDATKHADRAQYLTPSPSESEGLHAAPLHQPKQSASSGNRYPVFEVVLEENGVMTVTVEIPEDLAGMIATGNAGVSRAVLEAVALEGYPTDRLSEEGVRRLMGFETRMEVHGFLKEHGVYLH
jgi:hypothetical protein